MEIPGLPSLGWTHDAGDARWADGVLTLVAAAGVDWSNDASGGAFQHRATSLAFAPTTDFQLSARVRVEGRRSTFDAGVLSLWADDDHWAKLCFEWSPQGEAMVVSVVTNGYSDDANSVVVTGEAVDVRISRVGPAYAFHYSADGSFWHFVRLFRLHTDRDVLAGFLAQAPMGDRCVAHFSDIQYAERPLDDLRNGS
jgi:regulation of enolase protein 1 (concanavalin A-like superfamily)